MREHEETSDWGWKGGSGWSKLNHGIIEIWAMGERTEYDRRYPGAGPKCAISCKVITMDGRSFCSRLAGNNRDTPSRPGYKVIMDE